MKITSLIIAIFFVGHTYCQQTDICHPKSIETTSKKLIKKLTKKELESIKKSELDDAVDNKLSTVQEKNDKKQLMWLEGYLTSKKIHIIYVDELEEIIRSYTYYKIIERDTCISDLLQTYIDNRFAEKKKYEGKVEADSINGVYIPKNLEECFDQINSFWSDSLQQEIKKMTEDDFKGSSHFSFGTWMRNNWELWGNSKLSSYFKDLGVNHPEDMSSIILTCYYRKLTNKELKLEEQVKYYQEYWKNIKLKDKYDY